MSGPIGRPALAIVREGNPGHRPVPDSATVPPADFPEPDWSTELPEAKAPKKPVAPEREEEESIEHFVQREYRYEKKLAEYEMRRQAINGTRFVKRRAAAEWARVVPTLQNSIGLGNPDYSVVVDMCICVARLEWCEHEIAREGLIVMGQRGPCKNPMTTIAGQYRTQLKTYIRELGLSPASRTGLPSKPDGDDEDDPFD
ncbi:phage terminase small subunit P27 family [Arthrobacter sp. R-11]|uniref:phage terminase small subunit P27 family n=1 Tax=Arthrobacter sp. R-11 TaxID=3404053 RepID=UPI003CE67A2B